MATSYGGGGGSRLRRNGFIGLPTPRLPPGYGPPAVAGEIGDIFCGPMPFMPGGIPPGKLSKLLLDEGPRATVGLAATDGDRAIIELGVPTFITFVFAFCIIALLLLIMVLLPLLAMLPPGPRFLLLLLGVLLLLLFIICCCCQDDL